MEFTWQLIREKEKFFFLTASTNSLTYNMYLPTFLVLPLSGENDLWDVPWILKHGKKMHCEETKSCKN